MVQYGTSITIPRYGQTPSSLTLKGLVQKHHHIIQPLTFRSVWGPRICLGMRFALLELKTALCKIIRKYRIVPCEDANAPPELTVPIYIINPKLPIKVMLQPR
uniref:Putative cytochrome n=1 Tax=Ixodes ricinus TaxID=34613 RepID=A0A0K8RD25_IXORI